MKGVFKMSDRIRNLVAQNRAESYADHSAHSPGRVVSQSRIESRGKPAIPPGLTLAQKRRLLPSAVTAPSVNLVAQASARKKLKDLRPKSRKLGLMPVGRADFNSIPMKDLKKLSNSLGAKLGLRVDAGDYPGSTSSEPATDLFCKDLWTLQALALWVTDGMCYADQFPSMANIVTKKKHDPKDITPLISEATGHALFDLTPLLGRDVFGPDGIFGQQADSVLLSFLRSGDPITLFGKEVRPIIVPSPLQAVLLRIARGISSTATRDASRSAPTQAAPAACDELSEAAAAAAKNCEARKDATTGETLKPYKGEDLLGGASGGGSDVKASTKFPWGWVIGGTIVVGGLGWYFWPKDETKV